jgi:hypothetical protein
VDSVAVTGKGKVWPHKPNGKRRGPNCPGSGAVPAGGKVIRIAGWRSEIRPSDATLRLCRGCGWQIETEVIRFRRRMVEHTIDGRGFRRGRRCPGSGRVPMREAA